MTMEMKLPQTQAIRKGAGRLGARWGPCTCWPEVGAGRGSHPPCQGHKGARAEASWQANLRLLREENLGLVATGSLRRDLWWWRHLEGAKG